MRKYWDIELHDGPSAGERVYTVGSQPPAYGLMLEVPRHTDGGLFRRPRDLVDVYKVVEFNTAAVYKGTFR